jgi:hypothetical protein
MPAEAPGAGPFPLPIAAVPVPAEVTALATSATPRTDQQLHKQLRFSIVISAARCLFTYVVVPVFAPLFGPTLAHDPRIGIPLSVVALLFDVRAIRNIWRSRLRWRWELIAGYSVLVAGIAALLAHDLWRLAQ